MSIDHTGTLLEERYKLVRRLGRGGFADVWLAHDLEFPKREVAVKILHDKYVEDLANIRRFFDEAKIAGSIRDPNDHIVKVSGYGTSRGHYFLVMEYVQGPTLREELQSRHPDAFPYAEALHILAQICDGLAVAANEYGVAHRDLKPENIFLERRRTDINVKIVDLGIAKVVGDQALTGLRRNARTTDLIGTPIYMAPEVARRLIGEQFPDHMYFQADVYSLGVIFYEMLTGEPPFAGGDAEVLRGHLGTSPMPPCQANPSLVLPASVEALVMRCLEKSPHHRYKSADHLGAAIRAILATELGDLRYATKPAASGSGPSPRAHVQVDSDVITERKRDAEPRIESAPLPGNVVPFVKSTRPMPGGEATDGREDDAPSAPSRKRQQRGLGRADGVLPAAPRSPAGGAAAPVAQAAVAHDVRAPMADPRAQEEEVPAVQRPLAPPIVQRPPAPELPQTHNDATGERREAEFEKTVESPRSTSAADPVHRLPLFTKIVIGAMLMTAFLSMCTMGAAIVAFSGSVPVRIMGSEGRARSTPRTLAPEPEPDSKRAGRRSARTTP